VGSLLQKLAAQIKAELKCDDLADYIYNNQELFPRDYELSFQPDPQDDFDEKTNQGTAYHDFSWAACVVEIDYDPLQYKVKVKKCWIDTEYFKHWCGYDDLLETNIDRCIRCYRYSGSFIVYLRRTLEYSGRGIRSIEAYSLDEQDSLTDRKKSDNLVYDEITGETRLYHQK